jgi:prevent-host-death family protein
MRKMAAGEFKARCLAILDEVNRTGEPVIVTKRGKPVARVDLPYAIAKSESDSPDSLFGCLKGMATITGDIVGSEFTDEEWERLEEDGWSRVGMVSKK